MAFATIGTTGIADDAVTSAKVAPGVVDTEAQPNQAPIIINGDCTVAQKGTAATDESTGGYYRVDRMYFQIANIGEGRLQQETLTSGNAYANGFRKAWRVDCAVADASPAASDNMYLQYNLEGQDLQVFKKGTANAEKFTLAFWVKSNKTGTGNIQLKDKDNSNRQCTQSYTISSADTWEHKVCVFGADTTGAFDNDNGKSLNINWWLDSGSDYDSGTANHGTWEAQDNTKVNAGGTLNIQDNTANDWAITGIQLEVGEFTSSTIPPFKHESYGDNLKRCLRYFYCPNMNGESYTSIGQGNAYNTSRIDVPVFFPVPMRTAPSVSLSGGTALRFEGNAEDITASAISIGNVGTTTGDVYNNSLSGPNQGYAYRLYLNDSGTTKMFFNSEL